MHVFALLEEALVLLQCHRAAWDVHMLLRQEYWSVSLIIPALLMSHAS